MTTIELKQVVIEYESQMFAICRPFYLFDLEPKESFYSNSNATFMVNLIKSALRLHFIHDDRPMMVDFVSDKSVDW